MEATKKEKTIYAVKMMRNIRDKVSSETQNMNLNELKKYIQNKIIEDKLKPKERND